MFWGSTYLGIRIAVERLSPILLAGVRFSIAGVLMLVFCRLAGRQTRVTWDQIWRLAFIGILLLGVSNVVLAWSEIYVPTGLAALVVSVTPMWFLFIEQVVMPAFAGPGLKPAGPRLKPAGPRLKPGTYEDGTSAGNARRPRVGRAALVGVGLGVVGMMVLLWPRLREMSVLGTTEVVAAFALLGASFSWAFGSVLARHWRVGVDPLVGAGWQMAIAGFLDVALALALGHHRTARWDGPAVGAVAYLVVFGSWVGYSAYVWLLRHVPTTKVATYAYVNPVVAVILGWAILAEPIDGFMIAGAAIIVPAVALVTTAEHDVDPAD